MTDRLTAWEEILRTSFAILELAKERRWPEVAELHARRLRELHHFFEHYDTSDMADDIARGIDEILRADDQLERLMADGRVELDASASRLETGTQALRSYAATP